MGLVGEGPDYERLARREWEFSPEPSGDRHETDWPGQLIHDEAALSWDDVNALFAVLDNAGYQIVPRAAHPAPALDAERLARALSIARYWRDAYMANIERDGTTMPWSVGTHPLSMVIGALEGDPEIAAIADEYAKEDA